jgi:hypothetical protein
MAEIFLPKNNKKVVIASFKDAVHFYRNVALIMSLTGIREIIARYQAAKPTGERLN